MGSPRSKVEAAHRELSSLITSARLAYGMTQAQLGLEIGRDQTFISKLESKERRLGVIELVQITNALKADRTSILNAVARALADES